MFAFPLDFSPYALTAKADASAGDLKVHFVQHDKRGFGQLLITKQKATILYICNDYQWDPTWEPWLHHAFYYGMECKINVFGAEIDSWIKRQCAALSPRIIRHGPKSELEALPQTFTLSELVDYKRSVATTPLTEEQLIAKAKTQLRAWKTRGHIIPTEQEGVWEKC